MQYFNWVLVSHDDNIIINDAIVNLPHHKNQMEQFTAHFRFTSNEPLRLFTNGKIEIELNVHDTTDHDTVHWIKYSICANCLFCCCGNNLEKCLVIR